MHPIRRFRFVLVPLFLAVAVLGILLGDRAAVALSLSGAGLALFGAILVTRRIQGVDRWAADPWAEFTWDAVLLALLLMSVLATILEALT